MKKYLVVGCGYLGSKVATTLSYRDCEVTAIRANGTDFPKNVTGITIELGASLLEDMGNFDGVVFCVAAKNSTEEAYQAAYVKSLQEILRNVKTERFIFVSSTAVYPSASSSEITEESSPAPESFRGEVMLKAENLVADGIIARAGGIYGPGRMRYLSTKEGGEKVIHRIHVLDLANFCVAAVTSNTLKSGIYNLVDSDPASGSRIVSWLETGKDKIDLKADRKISNSKLTNSFTLLYPDFKAGYSEAIGIS